MRTADDEDEDDDAADEDEDTTIKWAKVEEGTSHGFSRRRVHGVKVEDEDEDGEMQQPTVCQQRRQ